MGVALSFTLRLRTSKRFRPIKKLRVLRYCPPNTVLVCQVSRSSDKTPRTFLKCAWHYQALCACVIERDFDQSKNYEFCSTAHVRLCWYAKFRDRRMKPPRLFKNAHGCPCPSGCPVEDVTRMLASFSR